MDVTPSILNPMVFGDLVPRDCRLDDVDDEDVDVDGCCGRCVLNVEC